MYSYIESRGGEYDKTVFFGLQYILKRYLSKPITDIDILEAELVFSKHGVPFNKEGWQYILKTYKGYLPVSIKAVPEGTVVPTGNVLVTIFCVDPKCFWLVSYLETILLRVWYPTTVATVSYHIKQDIKKYMEKTSDYPADVNFKLHDFGSRGVSSSESAMIGGMAHMVNFQGSDTTIALVGARRYYDAEMPAYSIPAAEHSTVTSWGSNNEGDFFNHMVETFGGKYKHVAVVSDSYDLTSALKKWVSLRKTIEKSNSVLVVRPDSGDPTGVVLYTVRMLDKGFGSKKNSKGYKVLNPCIRVIQGDGINQKSINQILEALEIVGYSADNINFGMGGALLQHMNRDTLKFAMKCSAVVRDGKWIGVNKNPSTDPTKASKKGLLELHYTKEKGYFTTSYSSWEDAVVNATYNHNNRVMQQVYLNGQIRYTSTLSEINARTEK